MRAQFRQWTMFLAIGAGILVGAVGNGRGANAQEGAPAWEAVIPDAALCQAEPRTFDEIIALFENAAPSAEPATADYVEVPTGRTASATLTDGVTATVHEAFACLNGGDWPRFFALLTDKAIVTAFSWMGEELAGGSVPPEFVAPTPVPSDLLQTIISVADVRSLGVDRAGAFVVFLDPSSGNPGANMMHLVFTRSGSDWLIDEVIEFSNE